MRPTQTRLTVFIHAILMVSVAAHVSAQEPAEDGRPGQFREELLKPLQEDGPSDVADPKPRKLADELAKDAAGNDQSTETEEPTKDPTEEGTDQQESQESSNEGDEEDSKTEKQSASEDSSAEDDDAEDDGDEKDEASDDEEEESEAEAEEARFEDEFTQTSFQLQGQPTNTRAVIPSRRRSFDWDSPISAPSRTSSPAPSATDFGSDANDTPSLPITAAIQEFSEAATVGEVKLLSPLDAGDFLQQSSNVVSVTTQLRSPVSQNPSIRGFRNGQIYTAADGAYFAPVRLDLDTLLSKIDPSLINQIDVISGPYGLRYGPGFSFLNIGLINTPRYDSPEHHLITGFNTRTNGGQFSLRETAYGGGMRAGYVASFAFRKGSDYSPGGGAPIEKVPSSYETMNGFLKYGFDLSPESRIEMEYSRYDESDSEYPGQFFDVNQLVTDAVSFSHIVNDPYLHTKKRFDIWFNHTQFDGDTSRAGKRAPFSVIDRVELALDDREGLPDGTSRFRADTDGRLTSAGLRKGKTVTTDKGLKISSGADFRFIQQVLREPFTAINPLNTTDPVIVTNTGPGDQTGLPTSMLYNPGLYMEVEKNWRMLPRLTSKIGGRADYVRTDADSADLRNNPSLRNADDLTQDDVLWAAYLQNKFRVNDNISFNLSGGHSERTPDLVDRYADGVFLAIMQSGFSRVIGDSNLKKEQLWQIDAGLDIKTDRASGSINYFYSFIEDYNLYRGDLASEPTGARLLRVINADLVTMTGFELDGQIDVNRSLSLFGSARYLVGDERGIMLQSGEEIDQPLFGISPLDGTIGMRLHDRCNGEKWSLELGIRMVDGQDRIARLGVGQETVSRFEDLEEATPGFAVVNLRGYYKFSDKLRFTGGIENLFDRTYQEHLDLRLPAATEGNTQFDATRVLRPGITPYFGLEWLL